MNFSQALDLLKQGNRLQRSGWNGKGMYVAVQPSTTIPKEAARGGVALWRSLEQTDDPYIIINAHIDMRDANGNVTAGWSPSQVDLFAEDWTELV
jgi:hypothetical protein